jgi:hypothetical protein
MMWNPSSQQQDYALEIDDSPGFGSIIYSVTVSGTSTAVPPGTLDTDTTYYWRVRASNECGQNQSVVFDFTTAPAPGVCGIGSQPVVYFQDNMEGGTNGWTHNAPIGTDSWVLNGSDFNSPTMSWHANDTFPESDQRLVSPQIAVPGGVTALTLQFWTRFDIEERLGGGCWDAGILEYSTNGGASWTQVDNSRLQTLPYTGVVQPGFNNPLIGLDGWCDVQPWIESVVDLTGLAGQNLNFRFRLGTDQTIPAGPWHIDDVVVQSCEVAGGGLPWEDGFENQ